VVHFGSTGGNKREYRLARLVSRTPEIRVQANVSLTQHSDDSCRYGMIAEHLKQDLGLEGGAAFRIIRNVQNQKWRDTLIFCNVKDRCKFALVPNRNPPFLSS
jgi:hypothetical protein